MGLARVAEVGRRLGLMRPSETVILVAGTNGKGSTCEYLEAFALSSGFSVGKSTSPHLVRFNERIAINGEPVTDGLIVDAFRRINEMRSEVTLTYFEFATLASLLIFKQQAVDVAILEVGLGGRLDAMNIVDPDLTIITSIGLDHQEYLGTTREEIGLEKAGIMRPSIPCLVSDREPPSTVVGVAESIGSPLYRIGRDFDADLTLRPHLPADSLAVATEAARQLNWRTDEAPSIASQTRLAGRRTWGRLHCDVLLDVAHNPAAAESLAEYLAGLHRNGSIHAVLGMYADKDIEAVTGLLSPEIKTWHLAATDESRAEPPDRLKARLSVDSSVIVRTYGKISEAFAGAASVAGDDDLILVFGSFPVVGTCLQLLPDAH